MIVSARYTLLMTIFLIGFSALVYEIYSVRVLFLFFVKSTEAVSLAISAFLAGIAFSSLIFSRLYKTPENAVRIVFSLQLAAAVYAICVLRHYALIPDIQQSTTASELPHSFAQLVQLAMIWSFLFMPAFFMGGAFPLINSLYLSRQENASRDTGLVYFWDTAGAILGALLSGYWLIPYWGLEVTLWVAVAANMLCCALVMRASLLKCVGAAAVLLSAYQLLNDSPSSEEILNRHRGPLLFSKESAFGTVAVTDSQPRELFVNYRQMCVGGIENSSEIKIGIIPVQALAPKKQLKVANIGLGCGITAASILQTGQVSKLDIIEINPVIAEVAATYFAKENHDVLKHKNVSLILQEGYAYLRTTDEIYDAVIVDVEEPTIVQSSALYTQEFFKEVSKRLTNEGVFALWSFTSTPTFAKVILNTLKSVFPQAVIVHYGGADIFIAAKAYNSQLNSVKTDDYMQQIVNIQNQETNTIAVPNAEKYYDLSAVFGLPKNHKDPFAKPAL